MLIVYLTIISISCSKPVKSDDIFLSSVPISNLCEPLSVISFKFSK
jgi:hypothetical protein